MIWKRLKNLWAWSAVTPHPEKIQTARTLHEKQSQPQPPRPATIIEVDKVDLFKA